MLKVSWPQALAWRLRRHRLEPIEDVSVEQVVASLGAIQWTAAALGTRARRSVSAAEDLAGAFGEGRVISSFAFRGATHLMTPESAGAYLALRKSARMFELPSWQSYYRLLPSDWDGLRAVVREALADGPLTVAEIVAAIAASPRFAHLGPILTGNPWSVMKAIAWHGDMSFARPRGQTPTFQLLERNPRWAGLPDADDAASWAVDAYLRAYGPATTKHVQYWLGSGLGVARKRIQAAIAGLADQLVEIQVDGASAFVLADDLDELAEARPGSSVRLLPAYDQWVMGPGTADVNVVPPTVRAEVSRGANIAVVDGVVAGTWSTPKGTTRIEVAWARAADRPDDEALDAEVARVSAMRD